MKAFNCPQCGASLEYERIESATVRCHYCHSTVVVPAELRPPPPQREELQTSFGASERPRKLAIFAIALLALLAVAGLLIATRRSPDRDVDIWTTPPRTPRATPTPSPRPEGYTVAFTFGGEGTGPGLFKEEMTVAVDGAGRIYASDRTRRVQRFDPSGQFLNTWNIPTQTKWYSKVRGGPQKLLANDAGQLHAVLAGVILKLEGETGEVLGAAHGSDYIHDAALAPGGGLLIVSQKGADDELVLLGADGRAARRTHRFVSSQLDKKLEVEALRVAPGAGGEVYALYCIGGVAGEHWYDDEDIAVFRFSPEGRYLSRFGGQGREPGQYGPPSAMASDARGRVYVCEAFDRIHVYEQDGRFLRTLKAPHSVDSLTFDAQNALYVAGGKQVSKLVLDE